MSILVKQTMKCIPKEELDKYPNLKAKYVDIAEMIRRHHTNTVLITPDGKEVRFNDIIKND